MYIFIYTLFFCQNGEFSNEQTVIPPKDIWGYHTDIFIYTTIQRNDTLW